MWTIVGLGNPGGEYDNTRHNIGRDLLRAIAKGEGVKEWKEDTKTHAQLARGVLFGKKVTLVLPDTYMNNSGKALTTLVKSKKDAESLVVVHDELDMPLGKIKFSVGSSAGGHRGVDSIQKALKTKEFVRIRIGISPSTSSGRLRKPESHDTVDFVLGTFKPGEQEKLKKVKKLLAEALELLITEGLDHATMVIHTKQ
ncbi:MAG: peptidyl-tRNA hydrolase, family [Patescibacteria group bacterium]|jgi:PTH1 family peptidyl-tRNA hydrolase|nr:peptidyl-tRNA hydrolase, family [Patescibacteria group bacterium]